MIIVLRTFVCSTRGLTVATLQLFLIFFATSIARGGLAIDVAKSVGRSTSATTIAVPAVTTSSGNQLLLAFIATDARSAGVTVNNVSGGGLTWVRVQRANTQLGTSEIWRTFAPSVLSSATVTATLSQSVAASITVISLTGADTTGTNGSGAIGRSAAASAATGAPSASLVTSRDGSWVFGVGNDYDRAVSRTAGVGQTVLFQYLATIGDTYWVQRQNSPTPTAGTQVFINDTAPTTDRYNLSIVEIVPAPSAGATFNISGLVTPAVNGTGATITLSQGGTTIGSATLTSSGSYNFSGISNGVYTVTPTKAGFSFNPAVSNLVINGASQVANFTASPQVWNISGQVNPSEIGNGATMALSGAGTGTTGVDALGNYTFTGFPNGSYTVTPSKANTTFNPPSQGVTLNGASASSINFTATAVPTWTLSGTISPPSLGGGATVTLSGAHSAATTADGSGSFSLAGLTNGAYIVTPTKAGVTMSPTSQAVAISGADSNIVFTATVAPTWSLSGTISPAAAGNGALLTLTGPRNVTTSADNFGNFNFTGLPNGNYTLTPSKGGYNFSPSTRLATINLGDVVGMNFTAQALPVGNYPDLLTILPSAAIGIVGTGANRVFRYTHDTANFGSGPLAIQPYYNAASGNYQGVQQIYSFQSGSWTLVRTNPVAGAFVFHAVHGHFHFPLVSFGLYVENPDGSSGAPAVMSEKNGFCIGDSFIYDPTLPHAGAFGNWGSCSDPTSLRGLSIGAVDEYDQSDPGQSINIGNLPDGKYWLRAIVDPENYLLESDESNNETDAELLISGNSVTVLRTVMPILSPPPAVTLISPGAGTISGVVQLTANTSGSAGVVQFLVDGLPFGDIVVGEPYSFPWDTTTVQNGTHWLAAQTMDLTERVGTSEVVFVRVNNSSTAPPSVQLTSPQEGATVSAAITLSANAAAQIGIPSVQFYVDGVPLGSPVSAPPFMTTWNTGTVLPGSHVITATATDQNGGLGNSTPVTVTVDNSHPANLIKTNVLVFQDGSGTMVTPAFSVNNPAELLVAFVAYDGPNPGAQTATVSGGGLAWQLAKRSNAQLGTAEIWVAKATNALSSVTVTSQPGLGSFHGSLTVIGFTNASGAGTVGQASAPSGAPDIYLPGVLSGSWVFAVGNDWDGAVARTPVGGQVIVHQRVDTQVGDTFWVQSTTGPSAVDGLVDIHDSAPTNHQWNYAAVEIVPTRQ